MSMFCYQCEQTAKGTGCTVVGVCGKDSTTAIFQDVLLYVTKGVAMYAHRARELGGVDHEVDVAVIKALFTTVTNVNFDVKTIEAMIRQMVEKRDRAKKLYEKVCSERGKTPETLTGPATFIPAADQGSLQAQGEKIAVRSRQSQLGEDVTGLQELVIYGLKGVAAYADHAHVLGKESEAVYASVLRALNDLTDPAPTVDGLFGLALQTGETNLKVMELLDQANTGTYGHPEPTSVRVTPVKGKAILVSGHDLKDLEALLKQTEGKGINIYTHGEMLPCNAYPGLKKYSHLVGNYGGAWQDQAKEFDAFPGAILMTTNCIQKPRETYKNRIFTTGLVQWPGVMHVGNQNFGPVIEMALASPGFAQDEPEKRITIGFAHQAVMNVAGQVIDAVQAGKIKHFFLIGGCDGAKPGRNYYTDLAQSAPQDTVILTLACGKYRFNKLEFGDIGGIPRLLDVGQCNDAYSAVQIAVALAQAFKTDVNGLPLSLVLSWYEQKAVAVLLTLLHLGIRNIRLGPSLPAFVTPPVLRVLQEKFNIMPTTTAEQDLRAMMGTR